MYTCVSPWVTIGGCVLIWGGLCRRRGPSKIAWCRCRCLPRRTLKQRSPGPVGAAPICSGSLSLIVSSTLTVHLQDKKKPSQFLFFQSPIKVLSKGSAGVNINKLQPPQNLQSPRRTCPLSHDTSIGQVTARRQLNRPHWWQRLRRRTNKMAKMWRILLVTNRG